MAHVCKPRHVSGEPPKRTPPARRPYTFWHFLNDGGDLRRYWKEKALERKLAHEANGTLDQQCLWDKMQLAAEQSCHYCYAWFDKRAVVCPQCHRPTVSKRKD